MDEQAMKRIEGFLASHDSSFEVLSKGRQEQLRKVDEAVQKRLVDIDAAKEKLQTAAINVSVIAEDTGIARKTFYNNDLLRSYVEQFSSAFEDCTGESQQNKRYKSRISELELQIDAFVKKDVDTENLRHENAMLMLEIKNLQTRTQNLEKQYTAAINELSILQKKLSEQSGHIIQMPSTN